MYLRWREREKSEAKKGWRGVQKMDKKNQRQLENKDFSVLHFALSGASPSALLLGSAVPGRSVGDN